MRVLAAVSERPQAEIRPHQDLVADLGLDSPKALRLLVELEDELGFEIPDEHAAGMSTVADLLEYARRRAGA